MRFPLLFPLVLLCSLLSAQQNVWLWEIKASAESPSSFIYLVLPTARVDELSDLRNNWPRLEPYFNRCGVFATAWPHDADSKNLLVAEMQTGDKKGLKRHLDKNEFTRVESVVRARLGDELVSYSSWEPLFLRRHLSAAGRSQRSTFWDQELHGIAEDRGKAVRQILSPSWFGAAYQTIDRQLQADLLYRYCDRPEPFDRAVNGLSRLYFNADWNAYREAESAIRGTAWTDKFLNEAQGAIVNGILNLALEDETFFVLDAVHMAQPDGDIISVIKERGWIAEPVKIVGLYSSRRMINNTVTQPVMEPDLVETEILETKIAEVAITAATKDIPLPGKQLFENLEPLSLPLPVEDLFCDLLKPGDLDTSFLRMWRRFGPAEKDFSIAMPTKPTVTANQYRAEGGLLDIQIFQLNDPQTRLFYFVGRTTYPYPFKLKDPVSFFDNAVSEALRNFDGRLIRERVLSTPSYNGREVVMELRSGGYLRSRLMLHGNKLYQLLIAGERDVAWGAHAEAYLNSFIIRSASSNAKPWAIVKDSRFSTRMPQTPITGERDISTPDGNIEVDVWSMEDPLTGILYFVSASSYPRFSGSTSAFLDRIVWSTASNLSGTVISDNKIKWDGRRGRAVEIQSQSRWYYIRFFFDGSDLMQVMAGAAPEKLQQDDIDKYFEALKWPE